MLHTCWSLFLFHSMLFTRSAGLIGNPGEFFLSSWRQIEMPKMSNRARLNFRKSQIARTPGTWTIFTFRGTTLYWNDTPRESRDPLLLLLSLARSRVFLLRLQSSRKLSREKKKKRREKGSRVTQFLLAFPTCSLSFPENKWREKGRRQRES